MKGYNKQFGTLGEKAAVKFLKKNGYKILETNFYTRFGELDIICKKQNLLVIVEVKTRTNDKFGRASEAVNYRKIQHIEKATNYYITKKKIELPVRFDVIEVYADKKEDKIFISEINHIEDAFWV